MESLPSWKEIPLGGIIKEPQSSKYNKTGSWRTERPVLDQEACIRCTLCWVYCPEPAILELSKQYVNKKGVKYTVTYEVNYDYCKGCGICSQVCPTKAIKMIPEVS